MKKHTVPIIQTRALHAVLLLTLLAAMFPLSIGAEAPKPRATVGRPVGSVGHSVLASGAAPAAGIDGTVATNWQWLPGAITEQKGLNCSTGTDYYETMVSSLVEYRAEVGEFTHPYVGEVYKARIHLSMPGNPCLTGVDVIQTDVIMPPNTTPVIDPNVPIKCTGLLAAGGTWQDLTNATWRNPVTGSTGPYCKTTPTKNPDGTLNYGFRPLSRGQQFRIEFPVISSKVLKGMAGPNNGDRLTARVKSSMSTSMPGYPSPSTPYQFVTVFSNPVAPTVSYTQPSATNVNDTSARLTGRIDNNYKAGQAFFDFGPTAAYGQTSQPVALEGIYAYYPGIWAQWDNLTPGTTYHWRLRFVAENGTTTNGANQTFTTTGVAPKPSVNLNPTSLAFGNVVTNVAGPAKTVTLTNNGGAPLTINGTALTGANAAEFVQTTTCGTTLAPQASCTFTVTFRPTAIGARTASLDITTNAPGSPHKAALTGTGTTPAPVAGITPATVAFGNVLINTASAAKVVTIANTGTAPMAINGITLGGTHAGDFTRTTTCGTSLAVGANCTISLTFRTTTIGARSASLSITTNTAGSPHAVALTGTGVVPAPAAHVSPPSLAFGTIPANTTSPAQIVTVTNSGTAAMTINGITVGGPNAGAFTRTTTCGATLAVGAKCTVATKFRPGGEGTHIAALNITTNAPSSPHQVSLTGIGGPPAPVAVVAPASIRYGNVPVNTLSAAKTVQVTNSGTAPLMINAITLEGSYASAFTRTTTCGTSLAAGASCTISARFKPAAAGTYNAVLRITTNAPNSPHQVTLTGSGVLAPLGRVSPSSIDFGKALVQTGSVVRSVTVANTGSAPMSISSITVGGTHASDFIHQSLCPTGIPAGTSCTVNIMFRPTATGVRTATLSVVTNARASAYTVALTGTGMTEAVPDALVTPTSVAFGSVVIDTTSAAKVVTLSNRGSGPMSVSISLGGTHASDFVQQSNCLHSLAPGTSCTISTTFRPTASGTRSSTLSIVTNAPGSPHQVPLSGTGVTMPEATLSATGVEFGNVLLFSPSMWQNVTLTNSGTGTMTVDSIAVTGMHPDDFMHTNTCDTTLEPGASCVITLTFRPNNLGERTADLLITTNAPNGPHAVALTGTGTN